MRVKLSNELKQALQELSDKEKTKLIFRLLPSHELIAESLEFELLEDSNIEFRRQELESKLRREFQKIQEEEEYYYDLFYEFRSFSAQISRHVKITKDKFSEPYFNLLLLNLTLEIYKDTPNRFSARATSKFNSYLIGRIYRTLLQIQKLDSDYLIEFEEGLSTLGNLIPQIHTLMRSAILVQLDVNWMISCNIPEDLEEHVKFLKQQKFI